ncbi:DEAD/DEAH box helicase [Kyrpidia spormannii]|uniref:SNF2-related protein n=1 Tax=Kyrpidia spormannii TaxID=2055160 RepID=A0ACA8Z4W7_9BACL|nr:SNF2-related protein [Kyrpidia spormannii]CAB3389520.1 SNF2-related protein [Kyrpidia spormannii]
MNRYLFKPNWDLLELNALEMDRGLVHFFRSVYELNDHDVVEVEFVNGRGVSRKLKVNMADSLLQGRGIKGLFTPYEGADYLFIEAGPDGTIRVSDWSGGSDGSGELAASAIQPDVTQRTAAVLSAMSRMKRQEQVWFDLYDAAKQFAITRVDDLICLPHIRELEPFEYQIKTVQSVIHQFKGRALLCDEVGLGKTVEAGICMMEYIMRGLAKKILILVPPSLINQWHEEMKRKFNQDFIRSDDRAFIALGEEAWRRYNKVIASLATAKRANHRRVISDIHYDLIVVDEAHHLKNRNSVAWQFVNSLKKKYMLLLTATPVQNSLEELYNLITLLKPGQLKTYSHFRRHFVVDNQGVEVKNADKLRALLSEVMIRNPRSSVDVKFTKRQAHTKTVRLSEPEQRLYIDLSRFIRVHYTDDHPVFSRFLLKSMQEQMGSAFASVLGSLEKLSTHPGLGPDDKRAVTEFAERAAEIAATEGEQSAKVAELIRILSAFGDKMIVFTKYRATQGILVRALRRSDFRVAEFHGGLTRKEKDREVAYFREEADVLVSTEVGGEGRNLQFCNGMVNFDLPWNPMAIEQRIGRIHRIGQTRDVFVYNLAALHTLEHHMLDVLDRKINLFELVVGEVDMILGDIAESEDFSDLVMNAWVQSEDEAAVQREMERIGEQLLKNKHQLERVKELDERLFS